MKLAIIDDDGNVVDTYDLETDDPDEAVKSLESYGPYDSVPSFNPEIWRWIKKTLRKAGEDRIIEDEGTKKGWKE